MTEFGTICVREEGGREGYVGKRKRNEFEFLKLSCDFLLISKYFYHFFNISLVNVRSIITCTKPLSNPVITTE